MMTARLSAADTETPNVLFLFTDDQRADTIHALGNDVIQTPNLDSLVAEGMTFRNTYCLGANRGAVCFPSRNMLLSGRVYFKIENNGLASGEKPNFADSMKEGGYVTYHQGKRGNTAKDIHKKFDVNKYVKPSDRAVRTSGEPGEQIVDEAIEFLQGNDKPFFMYLAFATPHDPRVAARKYMDLYERSEIPLPENFMPLHPFDNGEQTVRDEMLAGFPRTPEEIQGHLHDYYAVISGIDTHVGRLLQHLKESGRYDDTIIIYSSDHGLAIGSHGLMGKQSLYEHSMKPPLVIKGPGIKHGETDAFVYLHDIYPTVCELTGQKIPEGLDGRSFAGVLKGGSDEHREVIFLSYKNVQKAIRIGDWKLIRYPHNGMTQLFNLKDDPYELNNLAGDQDQQDRLVELMTSLAIQQAAAGDTDPLIWEHRMPVAFPPPMGDELKNYKERWKNVPTPEPVKPLEQLKPAEDKQDTEKPKVKISPKSNND
jgi:arylsulfatase A-like enzyme